MTVQEWTVAIERILVPLADAIRLIAWSSRRSIRERDGRKKLAQRAWWEAHRRAQSVDGLSSEIRDLLNTTPVDGSGSADAAESSSTGE